MLRLASVRLATEFAQLRRENFALALLVDGLARFVRDSFLRDVVVTNIFRSPRVQQNVYGRGSKKVRGAPHTRWLAIDVASTRFAHDEVEAILAFGKRYDAHNRLPVIQVADSRTIWLHTAGTREPHFHIQYQGPPIHAV